MTALAARCSDTADLMAAESTHRRIQRLADHRDDAAAERDRLDLELADARSTVADLLDAGYSPVDAPLRAAWDGFVAAERRADEAAEIHIAAFRALMDAQEVATR